MTHTIDPASGCWLWPSTYDNGYGRIYVDRKPKLAHRIYFERHVGAIPEGHDVHHACGRPSCVNPDHLEALPRRDHQRLNRTVKLTPDAVREIRAATPSYGYLHRLAERFGVAHATVASARYGRKWAEVA